MNSNLVKKALTQQLCWSAKKMIKLNNLEGVKVVPLFT